MCDILVQSSLEITPRYRRCQHVDLPSQALITLPVVPQRIRQLIASCFLPCNDRRTSCGREIIDGEYIYLESIVNFLYSMYVSHTHICMYVCTIYAALFIRLNTSHFITLFVAKNNGAHFCVLARKFINKFNFSQNAQTLTHTPNKNQSNNNLFFLKISSASPDLRRFSNFQFNRKIAKKKNKKLTK